MGDQELPGMTGQGFEPPAPGGDPDAAPGTPGAAGQGLPGQAADGAGDSWSKEGQAVFSKVSEKMAAGFEALGERLADSLGGAISSLAGARPEPAQPNADVPDGVNVGDLDKVIRALPAVKAIEQAQANMLDLQNRNVVETGLQSLKEQPFYDQVAPELRKMLGGSTTPLSFDNVQMAYQALSQPHLAKWRVDALAEQAKAATAERERKEKDGFSSSTGGAPAAAAARVDYEALSPEEQGKYLAAQGFDANRQQ